MLRARVARSRISRAMARNRLPSALRMTGAIRPWKSRSTAIARWMSWWTTRLLPSTDAFTCGKLVDRVAEGAGHERQVGEREALAGPPLGLVRLADACDALEVDLDRRVHVRARRLRAHHVLGRAPADVRERARPRRPRPGPIAHRRRGDGRRRRRRPSPAAPPAAGAAGAAQPARSRSRSGGAATAAGAGSAGAGAGARRVGPAVRARVPGPRR